MSYGLSGYSMYKTYVAKDTVTHINLDSNFYRGVNWSNKLADTIDRNFIRWYDFNSHDSTLRYFKVDTIRSNPHVDSIAGNTVITGAPIVTGALTVDSLKSTKGINATGGTFSGRITGSDVEVSDSIKGVTGTFSSALTSTTVNTGNGANELYAMDQNVRSTDAVTFTTLNTGNGANELYPMNQAVTTTSGVAFDSIKTRVSVFDSVKLGTGSFLKTYLDTTFYDSLYDGGSYKARALCRVVQIGNQVTMYQPAMTATSFSAGPMIRGLPNKFLPNNIFLPCLIYMNSSTSESGVLEFNNTSLGTPYTFILKSTGSTSTGSGQHGVRNSQFTWIIN